MEKVQFTHTIPLKKATKTEKGYVVEGVAATSNRDLEKDVIAESALKKMEKTFKNKPIHWNHQYTDPEYLIGWVIDARATNNELRVKGKLTDKTKAGAKVIELLKAGAPLGMSVGCSVLDYDYNPKGYREIKDVETVEVSITSTPANQDTIGTVSLLKSITDMLEKADPLIINEEGVKHARKLIKDGKIDTGEWKPPTLEDFNGDIKEYAKYHLAMRKGGDPENAGTYAFPYGKDGKVYRRALIAAVGYASGARGAPERPQIEKVARELLNMVNDKLEGEKMAKKAKEEKDKKEEVAAEDGAATREKTPKKEKRERKEEKDKEEGKEKKRPKMAEDEAYTGEVYGKMLDVIRDLVKDAKMEGQMMGQVANALEEIRERIEQIEERIEQLEEAMEGQQTTQEQKTEEDEEISEDEVREVAKKILEGFKAKSAVNMKDVLELARHPYGKGKKPKDKKEAVDMILGR